MAGKKGSDFNPDELAQKTDKHEQDISTLLSWANRMDESFGNNEKIASTLLEVSKKSVDMSTMLKDILIALVQKDPDVKEEVKKLVTTIDRSAVNTLLSRIGFGVWTILIAIIGAIVGYFLNSSK